MSKTFHYFIQVKRIYIESYSLGKQVRASFTSRLVLIVDRHRVQNWSGTYLDSVAGSLESMLPLVAPEIELRAPAPTSFEWSSLPKVKLLEGGGGGGRGSPFVSDVELMCSITVGSAQVGIGDWTSPLGTEDFFTIAVLGGSCSVAGRYEILPEYVRRSDNKTFYTIT